MFDVLPIAEARSRLSEIIKAARYGHRPVFIGTRGRAEVAVIDVDVYHALRDQIEEALDVMDARAELTAYAAGEGRDAAGLFAELEDVEERGQAEPDDR